jgi:hypothetical protein
MPTENMQEPIFHLNNKSEAPPRFELPLDVFARPEAHRVPGANGGKVEGAIDGMEPIDALTIPRAWQKEVNEPSFGEVAKSLSFFPPDGEGTALALYDRGFPIASSEAQRFQSILDKEPHVLSPAEISTLNAQVLGTVGDRSAFQINKAETKVVNGKTVLAVDGEWKEGGKKFHGLFVPKDESAREIQEVYFEGQEPHYSKFLPDARQSMQSIKWNRSSETAKGNTSIKEILPSEAGDERPGF